MYTRICGLRAIHLLPRGFPHLQWVHPGKNMERHPESPCIPEKPLLEGDNKSIYKGVFWKHSGFWAQWRGAS